LAIKGEGRNFGHKPGLSYVDCSARRSDQMSCMSRDADGCRSLKLTNVKIRVSVRKSISDCYSKDKCVPDK